MRTFVNAIIIVVIITLNASLVLAQNNVIKVKVSKIEDLEGHISIGLFNSPEGFPKRGDNSVGARIKVESNSVEYVFNNLNKGDYAIAVYHDENSNEELDRNFLGIPSEDYVFSNYTTGSFGPPSFEDAKFKLVDSLMIELDFQK